jgi:hypothetical protein
MLKNKIIIEQKVQNEKIKNIKVKEKGGLIN